MGLIETGSTLQARDGTIEPAGNMELVYSCDGCEAKAGIPYANVVTVTVARDEACSVVDDSEAEGWALWYDDPDGPCTRAYCRECATAEQGEDEMWKGTVAAFAKAAVASARNDGDGPPPPPKLRLV